MSKASEKRRRHVRLWYKLSIYTSSQNHDMVTAFWAHVCIIQLHGTFRGQGSRTSVCGPCYPRLPRGSKDPISRFPIPSSVIPYLEWILEPGASNIGYLDPLGKALITSFERSQRPCPMRIDIALD